MPLFSRDDILKADDRTYEEVPVPEWAPAGDPDAGAWKVRLRSLTGKERDAFEASTVETKGNQRKQNLDNFRAKLVTQCAVDGDGKRLFNSADIKLLGDKSAKALARLFDACQTMNGLSEEDVAELTEGFGDDPSEGSTSG
jgi:hypothetical protein